MQNWTCKLLSVLLLIVLSSDFCSKDQSEEHAGSKSKVAPADDFIAYIVDAYSADWVSYVEYFPAKYPAEFSKLVFSGITNSFQELNGAVVQLQNYLLKFTTQQFMEILQN